VLAAKFAEDGEEAEKWEVRLRARMGDASEFMKTLKQRFTIWYNRSHRRFGTLWAERFKSVLVEDTAFALKTVAAYIDLNPVRAGLVEDPADYRWCSYGEAMGGSIHARFGIVLVVRESDWVAAGDAYRLILFGKGSTVRRNGQPSIPVEEAKKVLARQGRLPVSALLRYRVRYFSDGAILGSRDFVLAVGRSVSSGKASSTLSQRETSRSRSSANNERTSGGKKSLGMLPLAGNSELVSWRKLRRSPIMKSESSG
jgi:hypothetical protein